MEDLVERLLAGDRRAAARLLTLVDDQDPEAGRLLMRLHPRTGRAHIIGVTGPPGSGKSTLVSKVAMEYRLRGRKVGIVAVDPTSPFTGGALLGDRIRMTEVALDPGVFIRSLSTRGSLGGLSRSTFDAAMVLDAYGCDVVLIETVGAGQSEVDIARIAHTTAVIAVPGSGDDIQAIKAGILEIGDVFIVNKADRDGVERVVGELKAMLSMEEGQDRDDDPSVWRKPILVTIAREGEGVKEVVDALEAHREFIDRTGHRTALEEQRWENIIHEMLAEHYVERMHDAVTRERFRSIIRDVAERRMDKLEALDALLRAILELEAAEAAVPPGKGRGSSRGVAPRPKGIRRTRRKRKGPGRARGKVGRSGAPNRPVEPSRSHGSSGRRRR